MTGSPSTTRRRFLHLTGVGALGLAGCTARSPDADDATNTTTRTTTTSKPTAAEPPDVDERVQKTPPGSPPLDVSGEWPAFRFDARNTGYNPDGTGVRDGRTYWRLNAGGIPSVVDGGLYNTSSRGSDCSGLVRRDPETAAVQVCGKLGNGNPPTIADGRVFGAGFSRVVCLSTALEEAWRGPEMDGIHGRPTVADGTVFVNSGGYRSVEPQLRAFDSATGAEHWRYDTGAVSKSTPAVADGQVFIVARNGLHVIDATDGSEQFVVSDGKNEWGTPAVADGTVYVLNDDRELLAIDAEDGTIRWRVRTGVLDDSPPVITDDVVFVGTENEIVGLNPDDGSETIELGAWGTPVAGIGNTLYAKHRGTLYAADIEDGSQLWLESTQEVQVTDTIMHSIAGIVPVDGAVYVSAADAFYGIGPA